MCTSLRQEFQNPPAEFSPIPFWFWNDALSETEITRQMEDFREKGVMGFVIHPRKGLPKEIPYLSDKFLHYVKYAVKEAARLHMHVVLYDEAMYPSGSAHGMVVKSNPEFAARALRLMECPVTADLTVDALNTLIHSRIREPEKLLGIVSAKKNEKNQILTETLHFLPVDSALLSGSALLPESALQEEGSVLFFLMETCSKGPIRGVHSGEDDGEPDAPAAADLLNPEAIRTFIRLTHDTYYHALKEYFGTTVVGMFTDEPDVLGRNHIPDVFPWTPGFTAYLEAQNLPPERLVLLWQEAADRSQEAFRVSYKKAINNRLSESYYRQLSEWCTDHNIVLTGHPAASDDIGLLRYFPIPGQDVVWRWVAPENNLGIEGRNSTMGKCSSDAARHSGKRRNSNECFGCCGPKEDGWAFTMDDMKWYLDWLFVRGVNLLYPHAFFYSIEGEERFGERPPDVGPQNTFWPYYGYISDYIRRMCWLMTDSFNTTPIAVLCTEDHLPWEPAKELFCHQLEFNYLEENLLQNDCVVENGWIRIQKQAYRILLLDSGMDTAPLSEVLHAFIVGGGHLLYWDREKDLSSAVRTLLTEDSACPIQAQVLPLVRDIRLSHVKKSGCDFYLLTNEGENGFTGTLCLPVDPAAGDIASFELWDAWNGTQQSFSAPCKNGIFSLPLALERRESIIYVVHTADPCKPSSADGPITFSSLFASAFCPPVSCLQTNGNKLSCNLSGLQWKLHTETPDIHFEAVITDLCDWTTWDSMKDYSGMVSYETTFSYDPAASNDAGCKDTLILDLGEVHEIASVELNGKPVGLRMWAPFRFDVSKALCEGENRLRITVTITPANRITKSSISSGLLGPMKLFSI